MRKSLLAAAAATSLVTAGLVAPALASPTRDDSTPRGTVLVTERQIGSVSAFDAATGAVKWSSITGATPIGVTVPRGTGKVYTSDEGANQMSVFDLATGARLATIPTGPAPHHLMADRDGRRVYVAEFGQATVGVVDTDTDTLTAHLAASLVPDARTHAVAIAPNGRDLYTTNTRADRTKVGDVAHIDARRGRLLCTTAVGIDPSEIVVAADGRHGYVSLRGENKVKELDLHGDCPVLTGREATVGTQPDTLQLTNDHPMLVVTLRGTPAQISLLDLRSFGARLVNIPGHSTTGHHWLSRDGRFSFVAVENPAGFVTVNNHTGMVVADHPYPNPPGGTRAHGVFALPNHTGGDHR